MERNCKLPPLLGLRTTTNIYLYGLWTTILGPPGEWPDAGCLTQRVNGSTLDSKHSNNNHRQNSVVHESNNKFPALRIKMCLHHHWNNASLAPLWWCCWTGFQSENEGELENGGGHVKLWIWNWCKQAMMNYCPGNDCRATCRTPAADIINHGIPHPSTDDHCASPLAKIRIRCHFAWEQQQEATSASASPPVIYYCSEALLEGIRFYNIYKHYI
jgi:hypothetical protein